MFDLAGRLFIGRQCLPYLAVGERFENPCEAKAKMIVVQSGAPRSWKMAQLQGEPLPGLYAGI